METENSVIFLFYMWPKFSTWPDELKGDCADGHVKNLMSFTTSSSLTSWYIRRRGVWSWIRFLAWPSLGHLFESYVGWVSVHPSYLTAAVAWRINLQLPKDWSIQAATMKAMKIGYCNFNFRFVTNFWDKKEMSFMGWKIKYKQSKRKRSGARPRIWTSQNIGQEEIVEDYETKNKNIEVHDPWSFSSIYIYIIPGTKMQPQSFVAFFWGHDFHISVPDSLLLACQATRSYTINSLKLNPPPQKVSWSSLFLLEGIGYKLHTP